MKSFGDFLLEELNKNTQEFKTSGDYLYPLELWVLPSPGTTFQAVSREKNPYIDLKRKTPKKQTAVDLSEIPPLYRDAFVFFHTYGEIQIGGNSTEIEVKKAFRRLAKRLHPDVAGEFKSAEFRRLKEFYEIIVGYRSSNID